MPSCIQSMGRDPRNVVSSTKCRSAASGGRGYCFAADLSCSRFSPTSPVASSVAKSTIPTIRRNRQSPLSGYDRHLLMHTVVIEHLDVSLVKRE